ncbi:response regulator [Bradyrhizobium sp. STM 3557]|uniref:response regulator n=1 Tax=Bradyrhizobium sp. STM 3557 TaxID=578920 RepID=UPI0038909F2E
MAVQPPSISRAAPSSPRSTIYVADDDADVLGSLRFLLETDGFEVRAFQSGAALLDALDQTPIDCFLIDYRMPGINGVELTEELRKRGVTAPVIMISGHYDGRLEARAAAAGVHDFLLKPLLDDNVAKRIRSAIAEHTDGPR